MVRTVNFVREPKDVEKGEPGHLSIENEGQWSVFLPRISVKDWNKSLTRVTRSSSFATEANIVTVEQMNVDLVMN